MYLCRCARIIMSCIGSVALLWHFTLKWSAKIFLHKIFLSVRNTVTPWATLPWATRSLNLRGFQLVTEKFEQHGFSCIFLEQRWFWSFKSALYKEKSALLKEMYYFYFAIYILEQRGFELHGNIFRPRDSVVQGVTVHFWM